jgi:hypothetical protein
MASVRRSSIFVLGLATGAFLFSGEATAADSTKWLIENPVSMMDWGSQKAKESAEHAADLLNKFMEQRAKQVSDFEYDKSIPEEVKTKTIEDRKRWAKSYPQQYGYHYGPGFAGYDLPRDRILVGVVVARQLPSSRKDRCRVLHRDHRGLSKPAIGGRSESAAISGRHLVHA